MCIQCAFDGVPATDAEFNVNNANVDPTDGVTVNGVLVVCNSTQVFSTNSNTDLRCTSEMNGGQSQQSILFLDSESTAHNYIHIL